MRSAAARSVHKKHVTAAACANPNASLSLLPPTINATGQTHAVASFAQQRIWLDEQTHFDRSESAPLSVYNSPLPLYINDGLMSVKRIRLALIDILKWHTVLRTAVYFNYDTGQLEQEVMPVTDERFSFVITHNIQTGAQLDALLKSEYKTPFAQLDRGLVVRCHLIQTGDEVEQQEYLRKGDIILFLFHHIAFDAASTEPFIVAFAQAYHHVIELNAKNELQYIDFSLYEQKQLADPSTAMNRARLFWSTLMNDYHWNGKDTLAMLLQAANKIPATRSGYAHKTKFDLDSDILEEQMCFASMNNVSMFQLGLACYFLFLYSLSYEETNDFCILIPTENRPLVEMKSMIGMFVNVLPYRLKLDGKKSFTDVVQQIHHLCLQIHEHSNLPYQQIIDCMPDKRPPLFQIGFQYESSVSNIAYQGGRSLVFDGAQMSRYEDQYLWHGNDVTVFDLALTISHNHGKRTTEGFFECSTDLIDKMTIDTLTIQFQHLCRQVFARKTTYRKEEPISLLRSLLQHEADDIQTNIFRCLPTVNNQGLLDALSTER
jgi:hypothetical protein